MDKKSILFVCYGLGIGGIEKCLVNFINALPSDKFNIDVLLMNPEYDMKSQIINEVNYLDSFKYVMNTTDTMTYLNEHGGILKNLGKFISYCIFRINVKFGVRKVWKVFKPIKKKYDIAIAYSQNDYSPYYVIDKIIASRKVLWYHNGAYEKDGSNFKIDRIYYDRFDYIVAVSKDCAKVLEKKFSFNHCKLIVLKNICDIEDILKKSSEFIPETYKSEGIHITTVGRLTSEKGSDIAIQTCKDLINRGYNVYWHWVGDGNRKEATLKLISEYGITGRFILEGNQNNPYPYIKNTTIYVQPSYYEAYSTTITEAKVLEKPIVTTDVGGMRDQIKSGFNGLIAPIDSNELSSAIAEILDNKSIMKDFSDRLKEEDYSNERSLRAYYDTVLS